MSFSRLPGMRFNRGRIIVNGTDLLFRLSAFPNLSAYFEAGLGETTDPGPPEKVSQLVSPIYVAPAAVARTVVGASDLTNAAWSHASATAPTTDEFDWISGSTFYLRQPLADAVATQSVTIMAEMWLGTGTNTVFIQMGGGPGRYTWDLSTGTLISSASVGGISSSIVSLGSGHYQLTCTLSAARSSNTLYIGAVASAAASAHATNISVTQYPPASPREYVQTIDQATFGKMPLRDTTGWGGGLEAIEGDGAALYMGGVMGDAMTPPFGFLFTVNNTSSGTVRQLICGTTASVGAYLTATDYLSYYDGSAASVISDAPIAAGKHIILVLVTATTVQAWIDGVAQTAVSVSSANFDPAFNVMANAAGAGSFFDSDIRSLGLYLGNWTTDGTRAGIESFLNSRAGGGII